MPPDAAEALVHPRFAALPLDLSDADPAPLIDWARMALADRGRRFIGLPEVVRRRPWSLVVRIRASGGDVWAKCNAAPFAHEAALVALLHRVAPGAAAAPLAVDEERGLLLTADGGPTRRDVGADEHGPDAAYGALQRVLEPAADRAVALGTPDVRDRRVVDLLEPCLLAAGDDGSGLRALAPRLLELADELSELGPPPTIEHNDAHGDNVFAASGTRFDFGDAVVGHPFLGIPDPAAAPPGYLAVFADTARPAELARALDVAGVLGRLVRAASFVRAGAAGRARFPDALPGELRALSRMTGRLTTVRP